ncbi:Alpha/Beta hydrolase protein [Parachaetomium inaequale]|uniref:Alpha/Beta hydrolase protein n=1 Tax=Parachaetomium inaequale TaxID=2588326 RepID=A0AAN6PRJ4_9PEZI|nr:Alpha/Beta hydrolase protein [Parachaetomium inaequale]
MAAVKAARLLSRRAHVLPGQLHVTELFFEVPKNHARPEAGTLTLFGRSVRKHERPIVPLSAADLASKEKLPYLVYLEGGPGFGNREPQNHALTQVALSRGYQVLYLDYRGTGLSTPVNADSVVAQGGAQKQADYLKLFRATSIVRDLEAVRLCLTEDFDEDKKTWSIFGQSFGGFVGLTYLSKYPKGLREAFLTGGLAPVKRTADEVYTATYKKLTERNAAYYKKYPEDIPAVRRLTDYIHWLHLEGTGIPLPSGGNLTVPLFLTLGLAFGGHGGLDEVHSLILRLATDLGQFRKFTRASLAAFESHISFDTHPIYAILHEAIYNTKQKGAPASDWAAYRVGRALKPFAWLDDAPAFLQSTPATDPLYFSGEMVYPFHFDGTTGPELARLKEAADILAATDEWDEDLYDEAQLRRNNVPVYAVSYVDDMYVDFELARETAALVRGIKVRETNGWYHDAVRSKSEEVFAALFKLRDDCVD